MHPRILQIGVGLALFGAVGIAAAAPSLDGAALGPAPSGPDGRFTNFAGDTTHGGFWVRAPFFVRRILGSFQEETGAAPVVDNDGAYLRENAKHSDATVTWVGHATLLVQMDHVTFLTDPMWSETASPVSFAGPSRHVPPGVAMEDLPPIDFVVISHNHYDHLDLATLVALAARKAETAFYVPLENAALLREEGIDNVVELDWGSSIEHEGVRVFCLPAQHWSKRGLNDDREALWSSWAVIGSERRFFFSGDTGYFDGFARIGAALGPFDLAAVPIGAYLPREMMYWHHMNPEEAVQAAVDLEANRAVAMHYGTFRLSDEPLDEPPRRFKAAAKDAPLGQDGAWLLKIGETRTF
jgi:N-acyl-phosphatidylethanolamine-hydrolysing phospholipase D